MTICRKCRHLVAHEWWSTDECDAGRSDDYCDVVGDPAYVHEYVDLITGHAERENRRDTKKELRSRNKGDCADFSPGEPTVIAESVWLQVAVLMGFVLIVGIVVAIAVWS